LQNDARVRAAVYDATLRSGRPPLAEEVAAQMNVDAGAVRESFARLAAAHVIVLQPNGEILMAAPFSAVPTPFRVVAGSISTFGNCIWDSLGIPAMLKSDAVITTSCGDCGEAMQVHVIGDRVSSEGVLHFALPAREWWNDIVFT
jgi:hypothetical protein